MNTNNNETPDSLNEDIELVLDDNASDDEKAEHTEKLASLNKQLFARLKKAEGFIQVDGKWVKKETPEPTKENKPKETNSSELSQSDLITLVKSNIHEEDITEVIGYAKFRGISLKDALESDVVKNLLKTKSEFRTSAETANVKKTGTATGKVSDDELLSNAKKGILPKSDEDMQRLARLSLKRR